MLLNDDFQLGKHTPSNTLSVSETGNCTTPFAAIFETGARKLAVTEIRTTKNLPDVFRVLNYHHFWRESFPTEIGRVLIPIVLSNANSTYANVTLELILNESGVPAYARLFNNNPDAAIPHLVKKLLFERIQSALREHYRHVPDITVYAEKVKTREAIEAAVVKGVATITGEDEASPQKKTKGSVKKPDNFQRPAPTPARTPQHNKPAINTDQEEIARTALQSIAFLPESVFVPNSTNQALRVADTTYRRALINDLPKRSEWDQLTLLIPSAATYQPAEIEPTWEQEFSERNALERFKHRSWANAALSIGWALLDIKQQFKSPNTEHFYNAISNKKSIFLVFIVGFLLGVATFLAIGFFATSQVMFPLTLAGGLLYAKYAFTTGLTLTVGLQMVMSGLLGVTVCALLRSFRSTALRYYHYRYTERHDVRELKNVEGLRLSVMSAIRQLRDAALAEVAPPASSLLLPLATPLPLSRKLVLTTPAVASPAVSSTAPFTPIVSRTRTSPSHTESPTPGVRPLVDSTQPAAMTMFVWKAQLGIKTEDDLAVIHFKNRRKKWYELLDLLNSKIDKHTTLGCPNPRTIENVEFYQRVRARLKAGDIDYVKDALRHYYLAKVAHANSARSKLESHGYWTSAIDEWMKKLNDALDVVETAHKAEEEARKKASTATQSGQTTQQQHPKMPYEKLLNRAIAIVQTQRRNGIGLSFLNFSSSSNDNRKNFLPPSAINTINSADYFSSVQRLWLEEKMVKYLGEKLTELGFSEVVEASSCVSQTNPAFSAADLIS